MPRDFQKRGEKINKKQKEAFRTQEKKMQESAAENEEVKQKMGKSSRLGN